MPQLIEVPTLGTVSFPDNLSDAEITDSIQKTLAKRNPKVTMGQIGEFTKLPEGIPAPLQQPLVKTPSFMDVLAKAGSAVMAPVSFAGETFFKEARAATSGDVPPSSYKPKEIKAGEPMIELPTVSPEDIKLLPKWLQGVAGVVNATTKGISGLSEPGNALIAPVAGIEGLAKPIAAAFLTSAIASEPKAIQDAWKIYNNPNATTAEKSEAIANAAVINPTFAALLTHGITSKTAPKSLTPLTDEALKQTTGGENAKTIRSDTGQSGETRALVEGSQADSGSDLQQAPSGTPAPTGQEAEKVTSAAINVGGKVVPAETHVDAYAKAKETGTPDTSGAQEGFVTDKGRFITREEAAQMSGLPTETEPGKLHSSDLNKSQESQPVVETKTAEAPSATSTTPPTVVSDFERYQELTKSIKGKSLDEAQPIMSEIEAIKNRNGGKPPTPPTDAPNISQGPPQQLSEGDTYGIAERVRDVRAAKGQVEEIPPGQGINAPDSIQSGRDLISSGANPEKVMSDFESTKKLSSSDMAVARAHGEALNTAARQVERQFGIGSPEQKAAFKALSDWDRRSKAMQTEWHKTGMAQQGETDVDTGSFTGLQRAYVEASGKEFTEPQASKAKKISSKVSDAEIKSQQATEALNEHLSEKAKEIAPKEESTIHPKIIEAAKRIIANLDKRADAARARIKARAGQLSAGVDPTVLLDVAEIGASHLAHIGADFAKWSAKMVEELGDWIKPYLKETYDKSGEILDGIKASKKVKSAVKNSQSREVSSAETEISVQDKAAQKALQSANDAVRNAAVELAKAESKKRAATALAERKSARIQESAARRALAAANRTVRKAAMDAAAAARKNQAHPEIAVWKKVRDYLEQGETKFDDIRAKVATDLGMPIKKVTDIMTRDQKAKYLANDAWKKQQDLRRLKNVAKRWLKEQQIPGWQRAIARVPRSLFALKVGFHGTVALGTHAPMVAFQPMFWKTYVENFGKMYHMVGSPAFYEMKVQDLLRNKNYITARRAGLVNDPYTYEDFNSPQVSQYMGRITGMGNRGYAVLKMLRQDMFDHQWENLPKTAQIPEVARAIADGINHATGVTAKSAPGGASVALFAPRLEASRVAWLAVDPAIAAKTFLNWKNATIAEKTFALNQVKEKAWVFGTLASLLAINQGILSATGSDQKINVTNPMRSDFLKFKAAGMNISYGNAMISMARLPARLFMGVKNEGKLNKIVYEDENTAKILFDYTRSQASPFAGLVLDLGLGRDFEERPLPRAGFGLLPGKTSMPKRLREEGKQPYTWPEYISQTASPIPFVEPIREVWKVGLGMSDEQIKTYWKAFAVSAFDAGTGGRITEDYTVKQ